MESRYSILVVGCDEYYDIPDFNALFLDKYWKNSGKKILVTETKLPNNIIFDLEISAGENVVWSDRILKALEHIETPYVILMCDDYFVNRNINNKRIEKFIDICEKMILGCLKLIPAADQYEIVNEEFGKCDSGMYRLSSMPAIWNVNYLKEIAKLNVNVWNFELEGSKHSLNLKEKVWCTRKVELPFIHAVNQGRWEYEVLRMFHRERIPKKLYKQRKRKSVFKYIFRGIGGFFLHKYPKLFEKIREILYKVLPNPHEVK